MGSLARGFGGKCSEILRKIPEICKKYVLLRQKGCGNSAESLREFRGKLWNIFCNDPFQQGQLVRNCPIAKSNSSGSDIATGVVADGAGDLFISATGSHSHVMKLLSGGTFAWSWPHSEMVKKSVSAHPGPILEERSGPGLDQDGPGWGGPHLPRDLDGSENAVNQSTWRIWTGSFRTRDGIPTGLGSDPGEGLDGTPRNSNRLLGLSDSYQGVSEYGWKSDWGNRWALMVRARGLNEKGKNF